MSNKVEFVAGAGINITADASTKKITISNTSGGGGSSDFTPEEINKLKNIEDYILTHLNIIIGKPVIIDQTGTYTIPKTGKYKMRLCGGGASGALPLGTTSNGINMSGGSGGNSGYLRTEELILQKDTVLNIVIGAGGLFASGTANHGGQTKVTIGTQEYIAKGGLHNQLVYVFPHDPSNPDSTSLFALREIDIPYDGENGSLMGGLGYWYRTGGSDSISFDRAQNIYTPAMSIQYLESTAPIGGGGGGAGGPILGEKIKAGKGFAYNAAVGYGAGGGGGINQPDKYPGNGAQGAVSLEYLGPN